MLPLVFQFNDQLTACSISLYCPRCFIFLTDQFSASTSLTKSTVAASLAQCLRPLTRAQWSVLSSTTTSSILSRSTHSFCATRFSSVTPQWLLCRLLGIRARSQCRHDRCMLLTLRLNELYRSRMLVIPKRTKRSQLQSPTFPTRSICHTHSHS